MTAETDLLTGLKLGKNEALIGLGGNKTLHIKPDGTVETIGFRELPGYSYLMYPLVTRVVPSEFLSFGGFTNIVELNEAITNMYGTPDELYEKMGPLLVKDGIPAERLAKTFLEMSPIAVMRGTNQISKDTYVGYGLQLRNVIADFYPGAKAAQHKRDFRQDPMPLDSGRFRSKDGVSF